MYEEIEREREGENERERERERMMEREIVAGVFPCFLATHARNTHAHTQTRGALAHMRLHTRSLSLFVYVSFNCGEVETRRLHTRTQTLRASAHARTRYLFYLSLLYT